MITKKEIKAKLENDIGKEIKVLKLKSGRAKVKEIICYHKWEDTVKNIMNTKNYKCPICQKAGNAGKNNYKNDKWEKAMADKNFNRKTHKEFIKEVKEKFNEEYTVLEKYYNNSTKIEIKHNTCGHVFMRRPNLLLQDKGCPKCAMKKRIKTRKKKAKIRQEKEMKKLADENSIVIIGKYKNVKSPVKMECKICGNQFKRSLNNMKYQFAECPICRKERLKEERRIEYKNKFINDVKEMHGDEYTVLGKYINTDTKILIRHNECGRKFKVTPNHFTWVDPDSKKETGTTCPKCATKKSHDIFRKSHKKFIQEIREMHGREYTVLGEYESRYKKIKIRHDYCGYVWKTTPKTLLSGSGCPQCNNQFFSKGMKKIKRYMQRKKIKYRVEYTFENLKREGYLRFDFAVFSNSGELKYLIEYDGKQHYEPIEYFGGKEAFKDLKKRDKLKNKYCIDNDINLIRIKYTEKDKINKILNNKIKLPNQKLKYQQLSIAMH